MDIKNTLINKYNKTTKRNNNNCLKLSYKFNTVAVSLYFDAYDMDNISFYLVLIYDEFYYFTSLKIDILISKNQFLENIPYEILNKIQDKNSKNLNQFYEIMREHIKNDEFNVEQYDKAFTKALANKNDEDKPFLNHLRKANMQNAHFKKLNSKFNFLKNTLISIKEAGYTIATTSYPCKQKNLIIALEEKGIIP